MDPRVAIINKRLTEVKRVLAIGSGKGGVGKSLIATCLSLILSRKGYKVGLMDLDFNCPSCHVILGVDVNNIKPMEEKGVIPPKIYGVKFMSIAYYVGDNPVPLRGHEISNAIKELFTITRWNNIDYLLIDLPPGTSDELLDVLELIKNVNIVAVTTPHITSIKAVEKFIRITNWLNKKVIGIIENMGQNLRPRANRLTKELSIPLLGVIPYIPDVENSIGNPIKLLSSVFAKYLEGIAEKILSRLDH